MSQQGPRSECRECNDYIEWLCVTSAVPDVYLQSMRDRRRLQAWVWGVMGRRVGIWRRQWERNERLQGEEQNRHEATNKHNGAHEVRME